MKTFLWVVLVALHCSIAEGSAPWDLYSIDATQRGKDFINILNRAFVLAASQGSPGEVVIQTMANPPFLEAPGLINGVIPYVQSGTTTASPSTTFPQVAPHSTLFVFAYNPNGRSNITSTTLYIVAGIEQIVTVAYRPTVAPFTFNPPLNQFTSTYASNVYPLYNINPAFRAADIQWIVNNFIVSPTTYFGNTTNSQVWILTTLKGPFYVPFSNRTNGLIPRVTGISVLSNSFLQITYQPESSSFAWSVIVAAEQVEQIIFYPNNPPRS